MNAEPQTLAELARALRAGAVTSATTTDRCLGVIAARNASLKAFIAVLTEDARAQAQQADAEIAAGKYRGPLHGIPISLKDIIDLRGVATTAASRVRQGHVAREDAAVVARLKTAGAVLIGKNNLHEFAFGTTNEDSAFGAARHPLDVNRSPGGSSGGSAAAVASGMAYAAIGTDTGGSIRIPSAACGLVGLKPTLGEIPTEGVVPLSSTLDHVGPICRSVEDAQILYTALVGAGFAGTTANVRRLRLGMLRDYFMTLLDPAVATAFERARERLRDADVELQDATIPHASDIAPVYLHIVLAEAAAYHAPTLERDADAYTPNVRMRLEIGRYLLAEDYVRALRGRDILTSEVDAALAGCDALLLPTLPMPAPPLGAETVRLGGSEEPVRNAMLRLTQLFNLTGHPAITIPCGRSPEDLPIGAQLVGRRGETAALLEIARAIEGYLGPGASR